MLAAPGMEKNELPESQRDDLYSLAVRLAVRSPRQEGFLP